MVKTSLFGCHDGQIIRYALCFALSCFLPLFARGKGGSLTEGQYVQFGNEIINLEAPWLTGPLLTPSAHTIPKGHFNIEPYIYSNNVMGLKSNFWHTQRSSSTRRSILFQVLTQFGLTPWMDFTIDPSFFYTWQGNADAWRFGDLPVGMSWQLVNEDFKTWVPAFRFGINETFPTGEYQHLSLMKLGTDASGGGSFVTNFFFVVSKLWHIYSIHFLALRASVQTLLFSPVTVHGVNSYGGDPTTHGRVLPGTGQISLIGAEYTLTKSWAVAIDILSSFTANTRFKGHTVAPVGGKCSYSLSLAPAIEFNYSQNIGLVAGLWFPVCRVNSLRFLNGVLALNIYI